MLDYLEDDLKDVLNNTVDCWANLQHKTIFITGGTGFFGIWLQMTFIHANRELNLNSNMILLTRDRQKFLKNYPWITNYEEIKFVEGDITDFEFFEGNVDYIIHAATEASVKLNLEEPLIMFNTIVNGMQRILDFAKFKSVQSFLFTSSGAVYGKQPSAIDCLPEDYIGGPVTNDSSSVYGEGKRIAEVLAAVYYKHHNVPVKIARCYAFIGPFLPLGGTFAAGNFIKNLIDKENIVIEGDGTPFRSYLYAADLMTWLWSILFKGQNNRPYNVGSDKAISISELANLVMTHDLKNELQVIVKSPPGQGDPLRYVPDISRASNELGLQINIDLALALQKTIDFNKHHYNGQ
jgi:nucleoside-diphosphate-sugar epimerase